MELSEDQKQELIKEGWMPPEWKKIIERRVKDLDEKIVEFDSAEVVHAYVKKKLDESRQITRNKKT